MLRVLIMLGESYVSYLMLLVLPSLERESLVPSAERAPPFHVE